MAQPLILYTGTGDKDFYDTLTGFNGKQNKFDQLFMGQIQSQTAAMGAGIYATPRRDEALEYGQHIVQVRVMPGAKFLDLTSQLITSQLRDRGVNPTQWGNANPRVVVQFRGDYHVIKTCLVDFQPG